MTAERTDTYPSLGNSDVDGLLRDLSAIRADIVSEAAVPKELVETVHANYRDSARNLLHYLALRRHDLRSLQLRLAVLGLSSLGRAESYVLPTLDAVLEALHRLAHRPWKPAQRLRTGLCGLWSPCQLRQRTSTPWFTTYCGKA